MTKIEWTEQTWNPIVGCSVLSPGCTNCYAMRMGWRLANNPATPHYAGTVGKSANGKPVWTGKVAMAPDSVLTAPLRRRKPTTYFVNSMGDPFHESVPDEWIDRMFAVMALAPQHTFQVLTKRSARMREYLATPYRVWDIFRAVRQHIDEEYRENSRFDDDETPWQWPLANVWLGVSVERQAEADERIPDLLATPAAVRFISAEPLLGPVDFEGMWEPHPDPGWHINMLERLDWVIAGGESGPSARPMHPDWARLLRDQCQALGVPFFFKQWGEWVPWQAVSAPYWQSQHLHTQDRHELFPADFDQVADWDDGLSYVANGEAHAVFQRLNKKAAGRLLDGREWNEMPPAGGRP